MVEVQIGSIPIIPIFPEIHNDESRISTTCQDFMIMLFRLYVFQVKQKWIYLRGWKVSDGSTQHRYICTKFQVFLSNTIRDMCI